MPAAHFSAGLFDEDAAHRLGGRGKEMSAAIPRLFGIGADQTKIGFVDQRRRLERLPWLLVRQPVSGELPQLVVNQGQQFLGGVRVALFDLTQNPGKFSHCGHRKPSPTSAMEAVKPKDVLSFDLVLVLPVVVLEELR
jgi:hypothetical protein